MERVTLEVYLQKVTIFVLCYCRRQPNPRNKTQSNLATNQTRDKNKNSYVVKLPETEFRLKGFGHLFSKRCEKGVFARPAFFKKRAKGHLFSKRCKEKATEAISKNGGWRNG